VALDADGLASLAGGRSALVKKLEAMFELTREDYEQIDFSAPLSAGSLRPYYWHGNEPDINAAYTFAQIGRPDLTQKWVAWLRATQYTAGPDGLPGNDDGGTMSAWFVWSALGLYPIVGSDRYVVGAPLFPHAEIARGGGAFTIDAEGVSDTNIYVQSVTLNGVPLEAPEIRHADIRAGGALVFEMGPHPSVWGRSF
jgi:putative alpha-1,2-mannosidase